ncbi:helix-turn-helix domain-containing protein [Microtetraspora malaysiensis]|uniref:helix-turn-helix domain-containing protein n=1 Tax=Microtetraspora malaysiensis TaxID=161358 RepID=UPI003D8BFFCF
MTSQDLVGQRIKMIRRQRGLSQAQLAHPELSDSYVSLIESGKRTPTPAVLELLAQKLDCSLTYLINGVTAEQMEELEIGLRFARLALDNGEVEEARRRFGELLADRSLIGLSQLHQDAEFGYALAAEACGHRGEAIAILNRLLDTEAGFMPEDRRVAIAVALCRCYREKGDLGPAVEVGETMLKDMNRTTWTDDLIELAATLLAAYGVRGDLLRATQFANELLAAADLLGTPRATVAANWNAARIAELTGRGEESLALAERALAVQSENGDSRNLARLRLAYAILLLRVRPDDLETARDLLARTRRELGESAASKADIARCSVFLARTELALGHPEEAAEHARAAKGLMEEPHGELRSEAHLVLGQAYEQLGRREEAAAELAAAGEWLERSPKIRIAAQGWLEAAEAFQRIEDGSASTAAYQRALACVGL